MADPDEIDQIRRSLRISRAVRAGPLITDKLEARLMDVSRDLAEEEAMDLEAHVARVLDSRPMSLGEILQALETRFLELAVARAQTRAEAGAVAGSPISRSADRATVRTVLDRMVAADRAWTIGWLRRKWGGYPLERIKAARPAPENRTWGRTGP